MTSIAAALHLLIATAFVSIPMVRARYGARAQAAAEAELDRQGVPATVLAENKLRFDAGGHETAVPLGVALTLAALAVLNLTGNALGATLSWILQPIVLLGNVLILHSQLTAVRTVRAHFAKSGDATLRRIDVVALLDAAEKAFPSWVLPGLQNVRHAVVMAGSIAVLVLLAFA
ncbi:hypothetical protein ACFWU3_23275 [Streptomyces sp. NPDC058685]|uniref:hypothetical protein n=1 Tax=Streptomyces sp. NPDC058685 TaxID=3346598 RepID=UPI003663A848